MLSEYKLKSQVKGAVVLLILAILFSACSSNKWLITSTDAALKATLDKNKAELASLKNELVRIERESHSHFLNASLQAASESAQLAQIANMVWAILRAELSEKYEGEPCSVLSDAIAPTIDPIKERYRRDVFNALRNFENAIQRNTYELTRARGDGVADASRLSVSVEWTSFSNDLQKLGYLGAAILVRESIKAAPIDLPKFKIQTVTGLARSTFRAAFQKVLVGIASSLPLVIIEGPIPLGKIITLLRTLWNVSELEQAKARYQREVQEIVQQELIKFAKDANANASSVAEHRLTLVTELNRKILNGE